jgi:hypothetical protein
MFNFSPMSRFLVLGIVSSETKFHSQQQDIQITLLSCLFEGKKTLANGAGKSQAGFMAITGAVGLVFVL